MIQQVGTETCTLDYDRLCINCSNIHNITVSVPYSLKSKVALIELEFRAGLKVLKLFSSGYVFISLNFKEFDSEI